MNFSDTITNGMENMQHLAEEQLEESFGGSQIRISSATFELNNTCLEGKNLIGS